MKLNFLFILLLLPVIAFCQDRAQVAGKVLSNSSPLENVHIKNVSSGKFSVSNATGIFYLGIGAGDTLVLSHVGMKDYIGFIKPQDLENSPLHFNMTPEPNELGEVVVGENSEINAVSLGIIPKKIKKLTVNERRLKTAGDFKPKHLLGVIGGGLSFDAILNAINGRTKKLKRNVDIEKKQRNIAFLEMRYMDYMQKEMELSEQEAQLLINFVIEEDELENMITMNNEGQMHLYLLDAWFRLEKQKKSD